MKTNVMGTDNLINRNDLEESTKETKEAGEISQSKKAYRSHNFGILDLWRMQKKHKTLGSSTRW